MITRELPSVPDGSLLYAVGDLHGQIHLLDDLLAKICADSEAFEASAYHLVFIGDYIDRGVDSAAVIERLTSGLPSHFQAHFLAGNHEHLLLEFLDNPERLGLWLRNGAGATLDSYGLKYPGPDAKREVFENCRDALLGAMPRSHLEFFRSLDLTFTHGDYLFVHAGLRPGIPIQDQDTRDLLWIREGFLDHEGLLDHVVVHGHTPVREPEVRPHRIGIDTGAVAYGRVTALRLWGSERRFLYSEVEEMPD